MGVRRSEKKAVFPASKKRILEAEFGREEGKNFTFLVSPNFAAGHPGPTAQRPFDFVAKMV